MEDSQEFINKQIYRSGQSIIDEQKITIERLKEQLQWLTIHYDSLRELYNNYTRQTEQKLAHYLVKNYEMEKQIIKLGVENNV